MCPLAFRKPPTLFVVTHEGNVVRFYEAQGNIQFERAWTQCDAHIVIPRGAGVLARSGSLGLQGCVIEQFEPLSPSGEPLSTVSVDGLGQDGAESPLLRDGGERALGTLKRERHGSRYRVGGRDFSLWRVLVRDYESGIPRGRATSTRGQTGS